MPSWIRGLELDWWRFCLTAVRSRTIWQWTRTSPVGIALQSESAYINFDKSTQKYCSPTCFVTNLFYYSKVVHKLCSCFYPLLYIAKSVTHWRSGLRGNLIVTSGESSPVICHRWNQGNGLYEDLYCEVAMPMENVVNRLAPPSFLFFFPVNVNLLDFFSSQGKQRKKWWPGNPK